MSEIEKIKLRLNEIETEREKLLHRLKILKRRTLVSSVEAEKKSKV